MEMNFELGPIRPPSESDSLLLRVTRNCPWNRCKFCTLYKGTKFSARAVEEIKNDIDMMDRYKKMILSLGEKPEVEKFKKQVEPLSESERHCYYMVYNFIRNGQQSAFLQDANSVVMKSESMAEVVGYLKEKFPEIQRVTTYARADTLSRLSLENLILLRKSGINRIHSGYESGSDNVLGLIHKGITKHQQIDAGRKVKGAGIELSVYFMPGLGGKELSEENASETSDVMNQINPDFIRIRTFVVKKESEIWYNIVNNQYSECSDLEKLQEIKLLITGLNGIDSVIKSDHIVNLLESIKGKLPEDKEKMLKIISEFEALLPDEKKLFQLIRRMGKIRTVKEFVGLSEPEKGRFEQILKQIQTEEEFEDILGELLNRYI